MTEQELIDGLISQRREAISCLVHTYQQRVIKTAFYFLSNMEDAEDVSQEVFLEVFRSAGRYRKGSSLNTWITRITINRSLDQLRKQKRKSVLQYFGSFLPGGNGGMTLEPQTADTTNEDMERRKILDSAVGSLPENQRIAFILSKYDDLSYKEIAEIMNLSLSSVESLIHRAKISLQKKLAVYFSEYANKTR